MAIESQAVYIPPFANVRLIECRDFMELVPVPAFREFFAYGKKKAREVMVERENGQVEPFWDDCTEDEEVWAIVQWTRFEDGHEEAGSIRYLRAPATEDDARKAMRSMADFYGLSKDELLALAKCFKATDEDYAYIDSRYPNYQSPDPHNVDGHDVYQARLKALAGLHPKTVALIQQADAEKDSEKRAKLGREAVQGYYAELAHHWTEDEVLAWQRNNPVGTAWMCEFARVFREPVRDIDPDPINYELAFNWLRRKYNLLSAEELSDAMLIATGQRVMPGTLKKRRERLGLTTKRRPGPPPKESQ